ncbi:N-acetylglucosamine-6-O-sulfatase-like [Oscarella lobularis]|uniref:N-acetylglucosamine-6-O-sulfatase-like n=1 Tax=Oscarella lobularis TaxID=121494 RepID=UPI0033141E4A
MLRFGVVLAICFGLGSAADRPNILFILADDMGQWAAGTYGNPEIMTPNIDMLAEEGIKFENAFCNTPVCSASRTSYFTGRLPSQHGVHDWIAGGNGCEGHPISYSKEETAYTDVLSQEGYTCGMSGKYHLGDSPHPQHGFSHWFVHQSGGGNYNDPPLVQNETCVHIKGYITDIITDDAIGFITNHTKSTSKTPFYASVHYTSPHSPYTGSDGKADTMHPKEIVDLYSNCTFSFLPQEPMSPYAEYTGGLTRSCLGNRQCLLGYYAAVTAMDKNIGRLIDTLKNLDIEDNTLVVFASDHGFNAGHHGLWGKGNAAYPLNMFDTSLKIPMIFRHKGALKPRVVQSPVQVIDVAPTLLDYAGNFTFPQSINIAGSSFKSILEGNSVPFKNLFGEYGQTRSARAEHMKYVTRATGQIEIYNLDTDPKEETNLVNDPSYFVNGTFLNHALREWFSFYEDPYLSGWFLPVTGTGQLQSIVYNMTGRPTGAPFNALYRNREETLKTNSFSWWDFD